MGQLSYATHLVGGDISYKCLGNDNYEITLVIYRDCFGGQAPFDNPAFIFIYDNFGNKIDKMTATVSVPQPLPSYINSTCFTPPSNVCTEYATYILTANLPPIAGGYNIIYQRCCRNNTISNLVSPGDQGSTYIAHIPSSNLATCNNSPKFTNLPPMFLCAGKPLYFDHSAIDLDGDSLVYSLCNPLLGASPDCPIPGNGGGQGCNLADGGSPDPPYTSVNYVAAYNSAVPMNANPALSVNPITGLLTGTPVQVGQWVIGICVSEYRNGVLLATYTRDFQFNVLNCPLVVDSEFPPQLEFCSGYTINFSNLSFNATVFHWDFGVPSLTNDTSNLPNPTYTFPGPGSYIVTLTAFNPTTFCTDIQTQTYVIKPLLEPSLTRPPEQCLTGNSFDFQAGGIFQNYATFNWQFGNASPSSSTLQNPQNIRFNVSGKRPIKLIISQDGCSKEILDTVDVIPDAVANFTSLQQFCKGFVINFDNISQNANNYFWDFGINGISTDTSYLFSPTFTYPDSGIFNITLVASGSTCVDTLKKDFYIYPLLEAEIFPIDSHYCLSDHNIGLLATGVTNGSANYIWLLNGTNGTEVINFDRVTGIKFDSPGVKNLGVVFTEFGCYDTTFVNVEIFTDPTASFTAENLIGCSPLTVEFSSVLNSETPFYLNWNFGDGGSSTDSFPSHTYLNPGSYSVIFTAETKEGCKKKITQKEDLLVNVQPTPNAGFSADDSNLDLFNPSLTITNGSAGGTSWFYTLSDGSTYNQFDFTHTFQDSGTYEIIQIVSNEYGCADTSILSVRVKPVFAMFIPNTFTPNGDDLNEIFAPKFIGVSKYRMQIFNRWGEMIFETTNGEYGWDGTYKGDMSQIGVYTYKIEVRTVLRKTEYYYGHINLLKF